MPEEERPREKMARLGAQSLSNDELLAIFLRTGIKGENAIAVGRRLLETYGGLAGLARTDIETLAKSRGLGLAKACQLTAAFELGRRLARQSMDRAVLSCPEEIHRFLSPQMAYLRTESLRVLVLDSKLRCIAIEEISRGTTNETIAVIRDILRPVILHQSPVFVLAHNHPSGDPTPSGADIILTRDLAAAARLFDIQLADHVIIGQSSNDHAPYSSFQELGLLKD